VISYNEYYFNYICNKYYSSIIRYPIALYLYLWIIIEMIENLNIIIYIIIAKLISINFR